VKPRRRLVDEDDPSVAIGDDDSVGYLLEHRRRAEPVGRAALVQPFGRLLRGHFFPRFCAR
jgi:hypothetical protein